MASASPIIAADSRRGLIMAMLLIAYTLNFIDRQIVGILAEPIKADLGLTDAQLGWMGGAAFALFYTALAIPIAMVADRRDRSWIIAIGLGLWSLMTAVCGLARNFWELFLARVGVGVGEAAGVAPAYSLIADLYPPEQRARALALFSLGIPIGNSAGVVFGGVLAAQVNWRWAFIAVGLLGVVFAPFFKAIVQDPGRGRFESGPPPAAPRLGAVLGMLARVLTVRDATGRHARAPAPAGAAPWRPQRGSRRARQAAARPARGIAPGPREAEARSQPEG